MIKIAVGTVFLFLMSFGASAATIGITEASFAHGSQGTLVGTFPTPASGDGSVSVSTIVNGSLAGETFTGTYNVEFTSGDKPIKFVSSVTPGTNGWTMSVNGGALSSVTQTLAVAVGVIQVVISGIIPQDNFTVVLDVSEVPLPAAAWLFGSALLGVFGLARTSAKRRRLSAA